MKKNASLFALSVGILFSTTISAQNFKFIDKANMNLSVKPGDNFVEYSNGIWVKNHPIPAKETRWGSFNEIRDFNIKAVKIILDETLAKQKSLAKGSVEKRIADFYAASMDSLNIESLGFNPIKADLKKVQDVQNSEDLFREIARFKTQGLGSPFFGFYVGQDRKNVKKMVPQFGQGGTSLPDRDYYLKNDPRSLKIQESYKNYISKLAYSARILTAKWKQIAMVKRTYEDMKSSGHLRLIRNKDVAGKVSSYYNSLSELDTYNNVGMIWSNNYAQAMAKLFDGEALLKIIKAKKEVPLTVDAMISEDKIAINELLTSAGYFYGALSLNNIVATNRNRDAEILIELLKKEYHLE